MNLRIAVVILGGLLVTGPAFADLTFDLNQSLDRDRTSMEYGAKIKEVAAVISGFKWVDDKGTGGGFSITQISNPYKNTDTAMLNDGMFFTIQNYSFDRKLGERQMYARQSERDGYVEFFGWEDRGFQMHIKVIDSDTIEVFADANESRETRKLVYKKVDDFPKNPQKDRLKSAKDSGLVW